MEKSKGSLSIDWKESARKTYLYILLFTVLYSLWLGIKMSSMLSSGTEVPNILVGGHAHILGISFLLILLLFDLRIKDRVEGTRLPRGSGEIIIGAGVLGHLLTTIGFSIASFQQSAMGLGMALVNIGDSILLYTVLLYIIVAVISEMYK